MLREFKPSGDGAINSLLAIVLAVPCAIGLACVYQYVLRAAPTKSGHMVFVVMLVALALLSFWSIRLSHVRNLLAASTAGLIIGVFAETAGHCFAYVFAVSNSGVNLSFADFVSWRLRNGSAPSPVGQVSPAAGPWMPLLLSCIWVVEAFGLVLAAIFGAAFQASSPYCTPCRLWANSKILSFSVLNVSDRAVKLVANATEFDEIIDAVTEPTSGTNELAFTVTACPVCHGVTLLSVEHKYKSEPRKPKSAIKSTVLRGWILLNATQRDALASLHARTEFQRGRCDPSR